MKPMLTVPALACVATLAACSGMQPTPTYSQANLPDTIKVPAGQKVAMETIGVGEISYECREKQGAAGQFEWVFVGPECGIERPRRQGGREVLRAAGHLGSEGLVEAHRRAACRRAGRYRQHPAAAREGEPCRRSRRDERHDLRAAGRDARRRCAGRRLRKRHERPQGSRPLPGRLHLLDADVTDAFSCVSSRAGALRRRRAPDAGSRAWCRPVSS